MGKDFWISQVILFLLISGCKKEEPTAIPLLTTSPITNVTATTATSGGNITSDGGATITVRGVCWRTTANPTTSDSKTTDGVGIGQFVSEITGLTAGLTYHVRAYATNSIGTAYGADIEFSTLGQAPTSVTQPATNITATGATLNGNVNANNLSTTATFEYGTSTSYGNAATATQSPVSGNAITNVSVDLTGLSAGTTYHFRIKTINSIATTYGDDMTFTTLGQAPTVTTLAASNINSPNATLNGSVNANNLSTIVTFEYGITTSYGQTVTATQSPVTGSSNTNVSASITGLIESTIYHFRVKAVNSLGTSDGSDVTFTTTPLPTVTDIDGNSYNTIRIATQVWMAENLKTTKYRNGDLIGTTTPATLDIRDEATPKYQWAYEGNESYVNTYGRLYTWYAVTDTRNVCPTGWHLPNDAEWTTLTTSLGGEDVAGGKLKEAGTTHWTTPNTGATNETGFTALPGGYRDSNGTYFFIGYLGGWWSSSECSSTSACNRGMSNDHSHAYKYDGYKQGGFSVRCLRD